ncbi:MAG: hypothetical protein KDN20_16675 [Verrucomicrobiae bacterium]|nr:hypothetical protein [Verrucomicrobiae bacterium]
MKIAAASIWILSYSVVVAVRFHSSIELPTSGMSYVLLLVCGTLVGAYGAFVTEVTRFVFFEHPIQTTIYSAIFSSLVVTFVTLIILIVAALLGLVSVAGDPIVWGILFVSGCFVQLLPATIVSSLISIPLSHAITLKRTESGRSGD